MAAADSPAMVRAAIADLAREAQAIPLSLPDGALERFGIYIDTLQWWQGKISLTGASTALDIVRGHIVDSLYVSRWLRDGMRVADIGSGAGFPGVPLAIAHPGCEFQLFEARRKRANFLREVVRQMRLQNVMIIEEHVGPTGPRNSFDVVVSRALGPVTGLLEMGAQWLPTGGLVVAMKGPSALAESTQQASGFAAAELSQYSLTNGRKRLLLVFRRQ